MAYRVVVDKPRQIRALTSRAKVTVADINLKKSQALVTRASYAAAISTRVLNAFASYAQPTTEVYYQNLNAIDVVLDPYSLNKYFRLEGFGISDAATLTTSKSFADSIDSISDSLQSVDTSKTLLDEFAIGDYVYVLLSIQREFADSLSTGDTSTLSVGINRTEILIASEAFDYTFSKPITESVTAADSPSISLGIAKTEAVTTADTFTRVLTFSRAFNDTVTLDDFTDIGAITKDTIGSKSNAISFTDTQTFATEKTLSDTPIVNDVYSSIFITSRADTLSVTESITVVNRSLASSRLNAGAFNTATLNN